MIPHDRFLHDIFIVQGEDNKGRCTNNAAGDYLIQIKWCPPSSPPFFCQMPFLLQPFQFILTSDRHQLCRLAYSLALLAKCGSHREIKLLEHAMKVVESIFEDRIRQHIDIDDMQFGFMKGKGTIDAIFIVRQMQTNFRVEGTHTHTQPFYGSVEFVRENPGEPVPEETFTHYSHHSHQSSLSAFSI